MTFNNAAGEVGFTFTNWEFDVVNQAIFQNNVENPAIITNNSGPFDFISFDVTGFLENVDYIVTSDLGNSYNYNANIAQTHTLNWPGITTITITKTSFGGFSSNYDNFIYGPTGTLSTLDFELNTSQINIYPNPTVKTLNISNISSVNSYVIFDVLGKQIKSELISKTIDVSELKKGIYFLKLNSKKTSITKRFVKK